MRVDFHQNQFALVPSRYPGTLICSAGLRGTQWAWQCQLASLGAIPPELSPSGDGYLNRVDNSLGVGLRVDAGEPDLKAGCGGNARQVRMVELFKVFGRFQQVSVGFGLITSDEKL